MTIFFYKGVGTNVSNKILLTAEKGQGYSFYRFWVIKGKPKVGTHPSPRLGLIKNKLILSLDKFISKEL